MPDSTRYFSDIVLSYEVVYILVELYFCSVFSTVWDRRGRSEVARFRLLVWPFFLFFFPTFFGPHHLIRVGPVSKHSNARGAKP